MLRPGTLDDSAAMAEIFNHYIVNSSVIFSCRELTADDMRRRLTGFDAGGRFPFFVEENRGRVEGYGYAHLFHADPVYDGTWELTMYLAHDALGRGIGTRMMGALIEECRRRGAHTLVSFVTGGNEACERMLLHHGFERVGCIAQAGLKFGHYLDDVIYQLML